MLAPSAKPRSRSARTPESSGALAHTDANAGAHAESAAAFLPKPPGTGKRISAHPAVPVGVSLVVHGLILLGLSAVVWRSGFIDQGFDGSASAVLGMDAGRDPSQPIDGTYTGQPYADRAPTHAGFIDSSILNPPGEATASAAQAEGAAPLQGWSSASAATTNASASTAPAPDAGVSRLFESDDGNASGSAGQGAAGTGATASDSDDGAAGRSPTRVTFGGLGASDVRSVVYVVDASGPMVTSLPIVMEELERSVGRLSPTQKFGVVIFRATANQPAAESFAPVLVRATPSAKQLLSQWLSRVEPAGRSSPLAGLELGLTLKPDAVFLLSRSIQRSGGGVWEQGLDATMARLEQLNPTRPGTTRRPVLIQTIQFLDDDPTGILQAIGQRHGGGVGYRLVRRQQDLKSARRLGESPGQSQTAAPVSP